jgi:DNA-binding transcriptional LysR family regulator
MVRKVTEAGAAMSFRRGQLEYFVAVAEDGQMTSAARRLGIAQPALSQAIAQLETELGLKLLDRHPRGVTLTGAGEAFYAKARVAVAASVVAKSTASSLARVQQGALDFGFLGAPPSLAGRIEMDAFALAQPTIAVHYRELPFPGRDTALWIADVDVAVCHSPPEHDAVWSRPLRSERRVALVPTAHALAGHRVLDLADLMDEVFVGFGDTVDPGWAGFWSLDDHRGGPPQRITEDRACNPQEVLAALASGTAISLVPEAAARVLGNVMEGIIATPVRDAARGQIVLVGHVDRRNPLVACLLAFADDFAARTGRSRSAPEDDAADAGRLPPAGAAEARG